MKIKVLLTSILAAALLLCGCAGNADTDPEATGESLDNDVTQSTDADVAENEEQEEEEEKNVELELVLTIDVKTTGYDFLDGHNADIAMIPFNGTAHGDYFSGTVIGTGVDTQTITPDGVVNYSARYMINGTDYEGNQCRVFIENNGTDMANCVPTIYTDSDLLADWETSEMHSVVTVVEGGVCVEVYKEVEVEAE